MKNLNYLAFPITLVFTMVVTSASAQNKISLMRYDDDFSDLKNDSIQKGLSHLKNISLRNKNYISFGGELREHFQVYKNINLAMYHHRIKIFQPTNYGTGQCFTQILNWATTFDFSFNSTIHFGF